MFGIGLRSFTLPLVWFNFIAYTQTSDKIADGKKKKTECERKRMMYKKDLKRIESERNVFWSRKSGFVRCVKSEKERRYKAFCMHFKLCVELLKV